MVRIAIDASKIIRLRRVKAEYESLREKMSPFGAECYLRLPWSRGMSNI